MAAIRVAAKAADIDHLGLELATDAEPTVALGEGQALVKIASAGVNPSDVKTRAGSRPMAGPRVIPHSDGAGVIELGRLATTWDWVARSGGLDPASLDPATAVEPGFLP